MNPKNNFWLCRYNLLIIVQSKHGIFFVASIGYVYDLIDIHLIFCDHQTVKLERVV